MGSAFGLRCVLLVFIFCHFCLILHATSDTNTTTTTTTTSIPTVTRPECSAKYNKRAYKVIGNNAPTPPALYSYPGSGNTWLRLLIEFATGVYTSSVYTDKSLVRTLPGEVRCSADTIAVKIHPTTHPVSEEGLQASGKCKANRYAPNMKFHRFVLPIRDPYAAIWSEFQRSRYSHSMGVLRKTFNPSYWKYRADELGKLNQLMWTRDYSYIYNNTAPKDIYLFKYEDLRNKSLQINILRDIIHFLAPSMDITDERLACAFALAESPAVHRGQQDTSAYMSIQEVYASPELVCHLWDLFGAHVTKYGYNIYNNTNCTGVDPLVITHRPAPAKTTHLRTHTAHHPIHRYPPHKPSPPRKPNVAPREDSSRVPNVFIRI